MSACIFHQMIALQQLLKMFFVLSKKLFSLLRYSASCIPSSPLFLLVSHCFRAWSKINLKVYDVNNCLNKNLIIHFVWYLEKKKRYDIETLSIDRLLNKEDFYGKIMQKICTKSQSQTPFVILVNNPKQPLHARNYFKNKIFWKGIIRYPLKS